MIRFNRIEIQLSAQKKKPFITDVYNVYDQIEFNLFAFQIKIFLYERFDLLTIYS